MEDHTCRDFSVAAIESVKFSHNEKRVEMKTHVAETSGGHCVGLVERRKAGGLSLGVESWGVGGDCSFHAIECVRNGKRQSSGRRHPCATAKIGLCP